MNPNLEMQVSTTNVGLYIVTYGRKEAPLDVQEEVFAANGLGMVSPAQLGFLRAQGSKGIFNPYSRTSADVFYDDRIDQVVVVLDGAISKLVSIANLVGAHRQGKEYIIPPHQRDSVYARVDEMLRNGTALTANHGQTNVSTSEFGQTELTSKLFSDARLGIHAQDYGDWQKEQGRGIQSIFFDSGDYAKSQKDPYLNKLRIFGSVDGFGVGGHYRLLVDYYGAFGVRFKKAAEGGTKK